MKLTGIHFLLTYQCTYECDHCFVWSSPRAEGVFTLAQIKTIIAQGQALGSLRSVYFEGGEPFLYYPVLLRAVKMAADMGLSVGIVSNAYWSTAKADALEWLKPFAGSVQSLTLSDDLYHSDAPGAARVQFARAAAQELGIPEGSISVAQPEAVNAEGALGQLPEGESGVMYRGRAAANLVERAPSRTPWEQLDACPYENLRDPGRVHVDPLGYVHLCQGLTLGSIEDTPLTELWPAYDPAAHPIITPLLVGGPAELARSSGFQPEAAYADACHLCYSVRSHLRPQYPDLLAPPQVYGL
jgi:hypothetical protein